MPSSNAWRQIIKFLMSEQADIFFFKYKKITN